jgi:hypothetical protein
MIRDPRNVLLSQKNKWKRRFLGAKNIPFVESLRAKMNYHPITISKLWMANTNHMKDYISRDEIKRVKFENIMRHPKQCLEEVCNFLGINFQEDMLQIPQVGSSLGDDNKSLL